MTLALWRFYHRAVRKTLSERNSTAENNLLLILSPYMVAIMINRIPSADLWQMMTLLSWVICVCRLADNKAKS